MAQTPSLVQTLKQCLKAKGLTYADVAQALELSEASIKRMFAEQNFSLQRLDAICELAGMELSELVKQMEASEARINQLTHQQENEIAGDMILVLVTVCVFNHWTVEEIIDYFTLTEEECVKKLLKLDKLGVIHLLPGNRVKLLISNHFAWIENGPFERFFREHLGREYFSGSFSGESRYLRVLNGTLSPLSALEFQRKLERLGREFVETTREDMPLPFAERNGITLVMAMRHWDFGLFAPLIRPHYRSETP